MRHAAQPVRRAFHTVICLAYGSASERSWSLLLRVGQDVLYQPIGLECGHKFCADCAFTCVLRAKTNTCIGALLPSLLGSIMLASVA